MSPDQSYQIEVTPSSILNKNGTDNIKESHGQQNAPAFLSQKRLLKILLLLMKICTDTPEPSTSGQNDASR